MSMSEMNFQVGEIVQIIQGREMGKYGIILGFENERFLLIADGDKRKFDKPKKKNIRHVKSTGYVSKDAISSLEETGKLTNGKMRFIIHDYLTNHMNHVIEVVTKGE
ncbi:KOW domain-containing RNA-binding protein [Tepidibacillus marianensis]|uniref:KOW domain-containing RNA-binding protein n=1 Tax=Tepidibacillus marianensis TaxID=3131995 RepID=UPI0030D4403B